jgi:hypothetical protein
MARTFSHKQDGATRLQAYLSTIVLVLITLTQFKVDTQPLVDRLASNASS